MNDWFRSISVLGVAFVSVVALTVVLAALIVPGAAGFAQGSDAPSPHASGRLPAPGDGPVTAVGGVLAVSGDRDGTFVLDREATDQGYALAGDQGRLYFGGDPLEVERVSYDGLEFYVDPSGCTLMPGERHDATGVAAAHVRCEEMEDIRGGGFVSVEGTVGVSADLLGLRGDLPASGGVIEVGDAELELPFAVLYVDRPTAFVPGGGFIPTDDGSSWLMFDYDVQTHALRLVAVAVDGVETEVDRGACTVSTRDIGVLNPRANVAELTLECAAVELVSGETVRIGGTIIADLLEPPE